MCRATIWKRELGKKEIGAKETGLPTKLLFILPASTDCTPTARGSVDPDSLWSFTDDKTGLER